MRIGIDSRLPYYERGGISQYVLQLTKSLSVLDRDNQYIVFQSRKDNKSYIHQDVQNFNRKDLWTPCHNRLERWSLAVEMMPHRLDILHSPDFIPPAFGAKYRVITIHDLNFIWFPEFLAPESHRYYNKQIDWACQTADLISVDSHHTRKDLIERLSVPPEKVRTIYLAANPIFGTMLPKKSIMAALNKFGLPEGFILFVGTLSPRKNVIMLLSAYDRAVKEGKLKIPLVLIGERGWQSEEVFTKISELGLENSVRHYSGVTDIELAGLYSAAGALVLPSYYEGFGLPPLEAMHCGCPVIVSNRSSLPEVVGPAGILIDPTDADGLADAIINVLTDTETREKMVQAGLEQASQFTWTRTATETLQLYQDVMA